MCSSLKHQSKIKITLAGTVFRQQAGKLTFFSFDFLYLTILSFERNEISFTNKVASFDNLQVRIYYFNCLSCYKILKIIGYMCTRWHSESCDNCRSDISF
jgi:hypothetical protein